MDLKRVTRIERSVHTLLADPEANHLTKPQQKEWKAIDVALQHLMQKMKGEGQGSQNRRPPPATSFNQRSAAPTSAPVAAPPPQPTPTASATTGATPPTWAEPQAGATSGATNDQAIENQLLNSGNGSLDSMLYELEMALQAAQDERKATRGNNGVSRARVPTTLAAVGGMAAANGGSGVHSASSAQGSGGKSDPDRILNMGAVVSSRNKPYGQSLVNNKLAINSALDGAGASTKEKALVMSMFMQETTHLTVNEGDRSKDQNTNGSANFSALNMNEAMLKGNGTAGAPGLSTFDPAVNLNDQANIGKAAVLCLDGIRERGPEAWIAGQRGGAPAAKRQDDTGTAITGPGDHDYYTEFYKSVATDYAAILKDPALMTNEMRVENDAKPTYGG